MATKLTLGTHVISALQVQAKKFGAMSMHLPKSVDLATSQANEIAIWTSKLIDAVTTIRQEAQDAAALSQDHAQDSLAQDPSRLSQAKDIRYLPIWIRHGP